MNPHHNHVSLYDGDSFPARKLTYHYPLKIDGWKMKFPFKMVPFQGTC